MLCHREPSGKGRWMVGSSLYIPVYHRRSNQIRSDKRSIYDYVVKNIFSTIVLFGQTDTYMVTLDLWSLCEIWTPCFCFKIFFSHRVWSTLYSGRKPWRQISPRYRNNGYKYHESFANPELPSRHDLSLLTHTHLIPQLPVVPRRMLIGLNRCLLQTQKHSLEAWQDGFLCDLTSPAV